jgi:hypothetical protein
MRLYGKSLITAKDVCIIHRNFIVIAITFSEKNWRPLIKY